MLKQKVIETINKYKLMKSGDKVLVAVSGGPDSICLLDILSNLKEELNVNILAVHVNHGIRKEAILDEEYVKGYCDEKQIKLYVENVDVKKYAKDNKKTQEEAGREVRYNIFNKIAKLEGVEKIAIAHNENDNAETILMNLLRGSSINGLKGITPKREEVYIRPLIETTREEIEDYCEENNLNPRHDKTNDENIYTRNKIRNELIPYIKKELNPNIVKTLSRLSMVIRDEEDYMQLELTKAYEYVFIKENSYKIEIDIKKFNTLHISIKRRLILYIIWRVLGSSKNVEKVHVDEVIDLLKNNVGNKYKTPNKNIKIYVNKGVAEFINLNIYNKTNL